MPEPTPPPGWFSASDRFKDLVGATRIGTYIDLLKRLPPGRMIDLGAGHGKFSVVAANLGWGVVEWVVGDVGEVDLAGYDLIACLGLWYHMTHDAQVRLAQRAAPSTLIIDTHVAFDHPGHRNTVPLTRSGDRRFYIARTFDAEHRRMLDTLVAEHNRLSEPRPLAWDGSGRA